MPAPTRRDAIRLLAAALPCGVAVAGGTLVTGCAVSSDGGAVQAGSGSESSWAGLTRGRSLDLAYAAQFSVDLLEGGYTLLGIADGTQVLVVPEGADTPQGTPAGTVVLQQPLERIYLVATQAMDYVRVLGAVGCVRFSGTSEAGWYIEEARAAMEAGEMLYAGKYSAPDYELIVDEGCDLAIENTMVLHNPEVKERLEGFGIPVVVERSSYEDHPLGRMEWVTFYGALLGRLEEAEALFEGWIEDLQDVLGQPATGRTAAFFYITAAGAVNVHRPGDYIARCVELAGGTYLPADGGAETDGARSTLNMQMESFYAAARDADVLIYNATIDGELTAIDDLVAKDAVMANFAAVKAGRVWCAGKNLFQEPTALGSFILDVHAVLADDAVSDDDLVFLHRLS